jgi:glycine cleavage system H protein
MMYPREFNYSKSHEWVKVEGKRAVVGITRFAADELGDVTYLELPEVGFSVIRGDSFGVIESIKAVEDLVSPLSGRILEANSSLISNLEVINQDPHGEGWLIVVEVEEASELQDLMTVEQYEAFVEEGGE